MARQIQLRRGTAEQHEQFIGADGEVTVDTTNRTLRVHDGETPGGVALAQSDLNNLTNTARDLITNVVMPGTNYIDLTMGPSGTIYTAPAAGYFKFSLNLDANHYFAIFNGPTDNVSDLLEIAVAAMKQNYIIATPVYKNQLIRIQYSAYDMVNSARFYYCNA